MKSMCSSFVLMMISVAVFASPVPADKLASYKEAVEFALAKVKLTCKFTPANTWGDGTTSAAYLSGLINQSTSADLNEMGVQPVLTFSYSGEFVESIAITTSADYKSIVAIDYSQYTPSTRQVNIGTIVNPKIVTETVQQDQEFVSCK